MKKSIRLFSIFIFSCFIFSSCNHDPDEVPSPKNPDENELITTMKLTLKESGDPSNVVVAMFQDLDGEGGKVPVLDTIRLAPGKTYQVEIALLDESKTPVSTITDEIEKESDGHQFFFTASVGAQITFTYSDADKNGVPLGLATSWTTGAITTNKNEKVRVILKHQGALKPTSGNGNSTIGSTDIDVNFPVLIQ